MRGLSSKVKERHVLTDEADTPRNAAGRHWVRVELDRPCVNLSEVTFGLTTGARELTITRELGAILWTESKLLYFSDVSFIYVVATSASKVGGGHCLKDTESIFYRYND